MGISWSSREKLGLSFFYNLTKLSYFHWIESTPNKDPACHLQKFTSLISPGLWSSVLAELFISRQDWTKCATQGIETAPRSAGILPHGLNNQLLICRSVILQSRPWAKMCVREHRWTWELPGSRERWAVPQPQRKPAWMQVKTTKPTPCSDNNASFDCPSAIFPNSFFIFAFFSYITMQSMRGMKMLSTSKYLIKIYLWHMPTKHLQSRLQCDSHWLH